MPASGSLTLSKKERLCSRTLTEKLFNGGGSRSMAAFPVRLVYMVTDLSEGEPAARMLVSVPKKCFKRAVKRNRVKRQVREAYRRNKDIITSRLSSLEGKGVVMAFIWIDDNLRSTPEVEEKVINLLNRLAEKTDKA